MDIIKECDASRDVQNGKVGFGSGGSGSKLNALFSRSVKQIPYNISVIEITSPIIAPGVLNRSQPLDVNISSLLEKSGCKTFAKLISDTGVLQIYETTEPRGLTVFAPSDAAFNAASLPDFKNLSNNDLISLLLYHALPVYVPKGVDNSRVESTLLDKVPLSIFKIDHVLIPAGFLPHSPVKSPPVSPSTSSPGAGPAPADSPDADTGNNDNNKSSGGVKASVMFLALVTVAVSGMISSVFG
ncbi:fasciclin-like arabinogalactan protein 10 [Helianthus annuus]|uniref:fasciclin-like arabinogalactan protein 10 n=1 Tax=Helianthus annuus TaxID=4232 RepID=UPI000B9075E6|nr:fasciclin-like arabinogalactan protein 10 [Helianthus annuus]